MLPTKVCEWREEQSTSNMSLPCNNYENLNILISVWEMIRMKECVNLGAKRS